MAELKPCPFCGEEAAIIPETNGMYSVQCSCHATFDLFFPSEEVATEFWNRRAELTAADVAPAVHGRWVDVGETVSRTIFECSVCGKRSIFYKDDIAEYPHCHCGAKMDLEG